MTAPDVLAESPARVAPGQGPTVLDRGRAALAATGAAILGAAPHLLHHAGPLAGAALLAGVTGKVLFGVIGLALSIPMLRRLHRRSDSWRLPAGVLAVMAVVFVFSSFVIGPALTGSSDTGNSGGASPATPAQPSGHESHHQ